MASSSTAGWTQPPHTPTGRDQLPGSHTEPGQCQQTLLSDGHLFRADVTTGISMDPAVRSCERKLNAGHSLPFAAALLWLVNRLAGAKTRVGALLLQTPAGITSAVREGWAAGDSSTRVCPFSFVLDQMLILVSLVSLLELLERPGQLNLEPHWDNTYGYKWQNQTLVN